MTASIQVNIFPPVPSQLFSVSLASLLLYTFGLTRQHLDLPQLGA